MPIHIIRYTSDSDDHSIIHETEWVSPTGWTTDQAIAKFNEYHPSSQITSFLDVTPVR